MTDRLQYMIDLQDEMQEETYGKGLYGLAKHDVPEAVKQVTINVLALTDELHELLSETSWKPWAKADYINLEAARSEFIDAWHFMLNLANLLGLDAEDIEEKYLRKRNKNIARQEAGYDGRSTKCPGCKRALDDDGVQCRPHRGRLGTDEVEDLIFCASHGRAYRRQEAA